VVTENIFKPTTGNKRLQQDSIDNVVRTVNFATSKIWLLRAKCSRTKTFISTWTCPDGKIQDQTDHILIDRRWHSSILDVRSFRIAVCDTDYYLVVAKVRERLAVPKQAAQTFYVVRFNLRKLNELEVRQQYQIKN